MNEVIAKQNIKRPSVWELLEENFYTQRDKIEGDKGKVRFYLDGSLQEFSCDKNISYIDFIKKYRIG